MDDKDVTSDQRTVVIVDDKPSVARTPSVVDKLHTKRSVRKLIRNESVYNRRKSIDDGGSSGIERGVSDDGGDDDERVALLDGETSGEMNKSGFSTIYELCLESKFLSSLLVFVPLGVLAGVFKWGALVNFVFNFLAIIPLAWLLGIATEDMALRSTPTMGGLMNATFGNAVELIVSMIALSRGMVRLVQTSLLGSILSNMLLVLGGAFFAGGLYHKQQRYNRMGAGVFASLLLVATVAVVIPAAFASSFKGTQNEVTLSRVVAFLILVVYVVYLYFQLKSHAHLFSSDDDDDADEPLFSPVFLGALMVFVTVFVSLNAEFLVGSVEEFTKRSHINETFVGVIIVPIVGNAAEHYTAIQVAIKDKMDLSIGVAIGSSIQIALFMLPFTVVIGVLFGVNMTLNFQPFETIVLLMSVVIVSGSVSSGASNYLQGALLLVTYAIVACAFFFRPTSADVPIHLKL